MKRKSALHRTASAIYLGALRKARRLTGLLLAEEEHGNAPEDAALHGLVSNLPLSLAWKAA